MNAHELDRLLSDFDPGIAVVYQGPAAGCPHCSEVATPVLPEAA